MLGFLRPKFRSEKDVGSTILQWTFIGIAIIAGGMRGLAWVDRNDISYEHFNQAIKYTLITALIAFLMMSYKLFWALRALWKKEFTNEPENVICLNCLSPFIYDPANRLKCPRCGGVLENLEGFFERHPDLADKEPKK